MTRSWPVAAARGWWRGASRSRREKVARFADEPYWGKPLPGFGDPDARVLLIGLAPAAHGGNRTGRVFTGDRSGDFLWSALHATGFADRASSRRADDGLTLDGAYIAAAVRCAPPLNRPTNEERDACAPFLVRELALLDGVRVIVPLGGFGWDAALRTTGRAGDPACCARGRASATGRRPWSGPTGSWARTTRASRTRSPASSRRRCSRPSCGGLASWPAWPPRLALQDRASLLRIVDDEGEHGAIAPAAEEEVAVHVDAGVGQGA